MKTLILPRFKKLTRYKSKREIYKPRILLDANESYQNTGYNRYPESNYLELKNLLAKYNNCKTENISLGAGSDALIDVIIRLFCSQKDTILINSPTFGIYEFLAKINNVKIKDLKLDKNFNINSAKILKSKAKIIFICSPNNPTGNIILKPEIINICKNFKGIVVVDEAYIEFCPENSMSDQIENYKNLIVLKTLSKGLGFAGLRIGYSLANKSTTSYLETIRLPYILSQPQVDLALKLFKPKKNSVSNKIEELSKKLRKIGFKVYPSNANFIYLKSNRSFEIEKELAIKYKILVKAFDGYLRISLGTNQEMQTLIKSLTQIICKK